MALDEIYPDKFMRIFNAYPKWPTGRTRKALAYKAYQAANRVLKFNNEDIDYIVNNIERRKRDCVTWQKGNKFGPVGLQVYINQRLWNEPYEKPRGSEAKGNEVPLSVWQRMGYADQAAYERGERLDGGVH